MQVREKAVALTDAFNYSDQFLNSALGAADGRVFVTRPPPTTPIARSYARLYQRAAADPMNAEPVVSPFTGKAHL